MSNASDDVKQKMLEQFEEVLAPHLDKLREPSGVLVVVPPRETPEQELQRFRAEADRLRIENRRLAELVRGADLHHIRLRDGLRRAIERLGELPYVCPGCDDYLLRPTHHDELIDDLIKLLGPEGK